MMSDPIVTMELEPVPVKKFMARYNRYEPKIRGSSTTMVAMTCLRKYFYQVVLGRVPDNTAIYLTWGTAYHKFREHLEKQYGFGPDAPAKYDREKALTACLDALKIALDYWKKNAKPEPLGSKFDFMTEDRLIMSCKVAFKHWEREKIQGAVKVIAVEQSYNVQLPDGNFVNGKADQIITWSGKPWGRDFKTTSRDTEFYARGIDPNDQFTGYTYGESKLTGMRVEGQFVEVLYNAKSTKTKEKGPEIIEFTTSRTKFQLDSWEAERVHMNKILQVCRDEDIWPMQPANCPFCPYHSVCAKGSEMGMMSQLETYYKVQPWDNTQEVE